MKLRYFSIEEAEALLPQIRAIIESGIEVKILIERKVDEWRKKHKRMKDIDEALIRGQVDFLASQLEEKMGQIADLGGVPKDLDLGLVDFPTRVEGKEAYLCWRMGEDKIRFWHGLTEGFRGRKPLTHEVNDDD